MAVNKMYAKNPKQLDICLKLLYAEQVRWIVDVVEGNKGKIIYQISVNVEDDIFDVLKEKYRILIS